MSKVQLPKDGLVRAAYPGIETREADEGKMPRLTGYALRFNEWTEIDSVFEGRFLERISPGAAKRTLAENRSMRILFNHGHDPHIGEKPLAEPRFMEDERGVRYDDPELFDADYVRELVPGLRAGQFGSSFKFQARAESIEEAPERSEHNPDGIPERTISEFKMYEAGPVVFPAYDGATAGVRSRSLTDEFIGDGLDEVIARWIERNPDRARLLLPPEHLDEGEQELEESREDSPKTAPPSEGSEDTLTPTIGRCAPAAPLYGAGNPMTPSWRL
jgi:HK97 family phage prohead protease